MKFKMNLRAEREFSPNANTWWWYVCSVETVVLLVVRMLCRDCSVASGTYVV